MFRHSLWALYILHNESQALFSLEPGIDGVQPLIFVFHYHNGWTLWLNEEQLPLIIFIKNYSGIDGVTHVQISVVHISNRYIEVEEPSLH